MPISAVSHRCRNGSFSIVTVNNTRYKSVFSSSFILYTFSILLDLLYPLKMLTLFFSSLLVSLSVLGIVLIVFLFANIFLGLFLFSICSHFYVLIRIHHPFFSTIIELSLFLILEPPSLDFFLSLLAISNVTLAQKTASNLPLGTLTAC